MSDGTWKSYNVEKSKESARPRLIKTLDRFFSNQTGKALDLGCGSGRDTKELLARGWSVDAVDFDEDAIELTSKLKNTYPNLTVIQSSFESVELRKNSYDLINASYSLPFCQPEKFPFFWKQIKQALKPNGIISCEFFGIKDSWKQDPVYSSTITFHTREEIESMFSEFKIEALKEDESDGTSCGGAPKHWHLFLCIGRLLTSN